MRVRTRSACVVLAWGILLILVVVGFNEPCRPAQANIRIAISTTSTTSTNTGPSVSAQPPASATAAARPAAARPAAARPAAARPAVPAGRRQHRQSQATAPAITGLPRWEDIVLLAAGTLIGIAFLTELVLTIVRRRGQAACPTARTGGGQATCPAAADPRILVADYDRLVVTSSGPDGTVCVLRPPGADPAVILLAARLVLAQDRYEELAGHLGVAANWRQE